MRLSRASIPTIIPGRFRSALITLSFLFAGLLLFSSCNITNPPAYDNSLAHKPTLNQWAIHGVSPGQIISGTITVSLDSLPANLNVAQVLLSTTNYQSIALHTPYKFVVNSSQMREGPDTLTFSVILAPDSSLGLLNALSTVGFTISLPVIVDNKPPTKAQNVKCVWADHPVVTWSPNQDVNFRGYVVRRYWPFIPNGNSAIDTIFNRQTTSFTDTTVAPVYGNLVRYAVDTWNGTTETVGDTVTTVFGGDATLSTDGYCEQMIANPATDQLYLSISGSVYSYSTLDNTLLNSTSNLGALPELVVTPDGSTIISFNQSSPVIRLDSLPDFAPRSAVTINFQNSTPLAMAADNNRFFIAAPSGDLEMVDAGTGNVTSYITGIFVSIGGQVNATMALSPDGKTLYCADDDRLYECDVSTGYLDMVAQRTMPSFISHIYAVPGASLIAVQEGNGVDFLNSNGLTDSGANIQLPSTYDMISCAFKAGKAYLAEWSDQQVYGYGKVVEYDLPSLVVDRQWTFSNHAPMLMAISHDGKYLYVADQSGSTNVVWIVTLQ